MACHGVDEQLKRSIAPQDKNALSPCFCCSTRFFGEFVCVLRDANFNVPAALIRKFPQFRKSRTGTATACRGVDEEQVRYVGIGVRGMLHKSVMLTELCPTVNLSVDGVEFLRAACLSCSRTFAMSGTL